MTTLGEVHGRMMGVSQQVNTLAEEVAGVRADMRQALEHLNRINGSLADHTGRIETLETEGAPLYAEWLARAAIKGFLSSIRGRVIAGLAIGGGCITIISAGLMLVRAILGQEP